MFKPKLDMNVGAYSFCEYTFYDQYLLQSHGRRLRWIE